MDTGKIITVNIDDMNEKGIGVARVDGAVVFIPGLVTGDTADIRILSREKNYFTAEAVEINSPSSLRIKPACDVKDCGGCSLSHVTYEEENRIKKNSVRNAFRRSGLPFDMVEDTVHAEDRTAYRNKITVHYSKSARMFGLYAEGTNDVISFSSCAICSDVMSDIIRFTNENIGLLPNDSVESLCVRTNCIGKVTVSVYASKLLNLDCYKAAVCERFDSVENVVLIVDGCGGSFIEDRIAGVDMRFSSEAFRQVNHEAFEMLLKVVHSIAKEARFSIAADLYCGSGVIGLTLAKAFPEAKFYGIEINPNAVSDAKYNAMSNELDNIEFFCGDSASFKKRIAKGKLPELIVVDPPRAGLSKEMRNGLAELSPKEIIYVSCNPQTLARDIASLRSFGYEIGRVVPVNMFPMTSHCECVVKLTRKD
ncbi:MAG: class I SAM-dependent RNA methyltransferase [Ruminococcaceae bacterium]|nr:class I SAM-dependent RNA methyltransferase [Oscillospiraceae bacterium]